jgi:prepilin-type N-terminal cleavage/methylation domain-containing protein
MLYLRSKKGFTLLELIIVVIVIGILASIALPRFIRVAERARISEAKSILDALRGSQMRYLAQWNTYTGTPTLLDTPVPPARFFTFSPVAAGSGATTAPIAQAGRNTVENPGAPFVAYVVTISPDGQLTSTNTDVTPLL